MTPEMHDAIIMDMIRRKYGPMTPESRAGRTPESYGQWTVPHRPGDDSVEQQIARGVARAPQDVMEAAGIGQAARSVHGAYLDPSRENIGKAAWDSALSMPGMSLIGKAAGPASAAARSMIPVTASGRTFMGAGLLGGGAVVGAAEAGDADPFAGITSQIQAAQQRLSDHEASKSKAEDALGAQWKSQRLGPEARAKAKATFDAEWSNKAAPIMSELSSLTDARTKLLSQSEMEKATAASAESRRLKEANTRIADLYPSETKAAQAASVLGGLLLSGAVKGRNVARYNGEMQTASDRATSAAAQGQAAYGRGAFPAAAGHVTEAKAAQAQLDAILAAGPSSKGTMLPTIAGMDGAFLGPQLVDRYARAEPGSKLYNESDPFKNPAETFMRMGGAALGGGLMSKLPTSAAGLIQAQKAPGAQGMINSLDGMSNGRAMIDADMMKRTAIDGAKARGEMVTANGAVRELMSGEREAARRSGAGSAGQTIDGEVMQPGAAGQLQPVPIDPTQIQGQRPSVGLLGNSSPVPVPPAGIQIATTPNGGQPNLSPYPANIDRMISGTAQGEQWANTQSAAARAGLLDQLDRGKNLLPKQGKMGDPNSIVPADVSGAPAATTRKQLDLLRDVLLHRGVDISKISREQLAEHLKTIDPRIFAVPAAIGVGASQAPRGLLDQ